MDSARSEGHHHHPFPTSMHFTRKTQLPLQNGNPEREDGGGGGGDNMAMGTFRGHSKVYVGHLSPEVTRDNLIDFLIDVGKVAEQAITKVNVKTGFAFVEFLGGNTADDVVNMCNSKPFMNTVVRVEKAVNSESYTKRVQNSKLIQVMVANCNETMSKDELRELLEEGKVNVVNMEEVRGRLGTKSFVVRVANMRMAQRIVDEWGNKIINGNRLQMNILDEPFGDGAGDSSYSVQQASLYATDGMVDVRSVDIPLRILVPNDFIGAIIGRGGATIRAISKGTGARLDIYRHVNRNYDMPEKPLSIAGPKDKTSQACRKVLEIIAQEADHVKEGMGDIALKIFVPNAVVGRIIGKGGTVIKTMMEDTQTKIHISNQPDFMEDNYMNRRNNNSNQRIITVRGSIDGMCQAEMIISDKIREALAEGKVRERDLEFGYNFGSRPNPSGGMVYSYNGQSPAHSSSPYLSPMSPNKYQYERRFEPYGMRYSPSSSNYPMPLEEGVILSRPETAFMYVPDEIVGALIGRKGESIREIIHASGASIKILEGIIYVSSYPTRRVVIHGGAQSIFFAETLIFDKVMRDWPGASEHGQELTVEMTVPTEFVGRLIGKGGANVREIQRQHYCKVKYMTEPDTCIPPPVEGETYVRITGNAEGFGNAQKKVRSSLAKIMSRTFSHSRNNDSNNDSRLNPTEEVNFSQSDNSHHE